MRLIHAPMRPVRGFALVEVMVALAILAVGMLGMAVLLLQSLRASRAASERTQAVNLASDIVERMRANRAAGVAYDTETGSPDPRFVAACESRIDDCDPATLAGHDLRGWLDGVSAALPGGVGTVRVDHPAGGLDRWTISVSWSGGDEAEAARYVLVMDL